MTTANKRIAGAFLVGLGLIILAYFLSISQVDEATTTTAEPIVVASEPRQFITVTDENGDGVPDWQEALQKTDPVVLNEVDPNYEAPDTLTGEFAIQFLQDMVLAENSGSFGASPEQLVIEATSDFQDAAKDELFTVGDIKVDYDNSAEATRNYLIELANITYRYPVPEGTPNEVEALQKAYQTNDPATLESLKLRVESYKNIVADTAALTAPSNYAALHLDYLNSLNAIYNDLKGFEMAFSDPLYAFLRLQRYQADALALQNVLTEINRKSTADNIIINPEDLDLGQ